ACNLTSVGNIMNFEDDQIRVSSENSVNSVASDHSTTLLIENIVDLTVENNSEHSTKTAQTISPADLDYNPLDVLNGFLERENQNNKDRYKKSAESENAIGMCIIVIVEQDIHILPKPAKADGSLETVLR
ncbi:4413_t:CDS:2, partial [Racocetra fulgida]